MLMLSIRRQRAAHRGRRRSPDAAPRAVLRAGRRHHGGAAVARWPRRCRPAALTPSISSLLVLFAVTLPWSVIGFWNAAIGFLIMRFCARSGGGGGAGGAQRARRRADHRLDRDPDLHPQRAAGARAPQSRRRCWQGLAAARRRGALPCLCAQRHQRRRDRGRRGGSRFAALAADMARPHRASPIAGAPTTPASRPATSAISASAGAATTTSRSRSTPTAS